VCKKVVFKFLYGRLKNHQPVPYVDSYGNVASSANDKVGKTLGLFVLQHRNTILDSISLINYGMCFLQ
jgi:hypothetical protein